MVALSNSYPYSNTAYRYAPRPSIPLYAPQTPLIRPAFQRPYSYPPQYYLAPQSTQYIMPQYRPVPFSPAPAFSLPSYNTLPLPEVAIPAAPVAVPEPAVETPAPKAVMPASAPIVQSTPTSQKAQETQATTATQEPETFSQRTGQKVGDAVTRLLDENPQWENTLNNVNIDKLLDDPNSFIYRIRTAYQDSRILKFVSKQFSKQIIKALPDDMEPAAGNLLDWLNAKGESSPSVSVLA